MNLRYPTTSRCAAVKKFQKPYFLPPRLLMCKTVCNLDEPPINQILAYRFLFLYPLRILMDHCLSTIFSRLFRGLIHIIWFYAYGYCSAIAKIVTHFLYALAFGNGIFLDKRPSIHSNISICYSKLSNGCISLPNIIFRFSLRSACTKYHSLYMYHKIFFTISGFFSSVNDIFHL